MRYKSKDFFVDNVKVEVLAKKYSTPIYCYSYKKLKENIQNFKKILNLLIQLYVSQLKQMQIKHC